MSKIKNITFKKIEKTQIKIHLESGTEYNEYIKINLKYIENIKELIGLEIFDQETIDKKIEQLKINKKLKMELSNIILKTASKEQNIEPFEYINNNRKIPKIIANTKKQYKIVNTNYKTITNILNEINKKNIILTGNNPLIFDIAVAMNIKYIKTKINNNRLTEISKIIKI